MKEYTKKDLANDLKNIIGHTELYDKYKWMLNSANEKDQQELENLISFNKQKVDDLFSKILNNWKE